MFTEQDIEELDPAYYWFKALRSISCAVCGQCVWQAAKCVYKADTFRLGENIYYVPSYHSLCRKLFTLTPYLYV